MFLITYCVTIYSIFSPEVVWIAFLKLFNEFEWGIINIIGNWRELKHKKDNKSASIQRTEGNNFGLNC